MYALLAIIPSLIGITVCITLIAVLDDRQSRQRLARRLLFGKPMPPPKPKKWPIKKRLRVAAKILIGRL